MVNNVGTLRKVDIAKVWPKEEYDFTPWLAEHGLPVLLKEIGIDGVQAIGREVHCGDKNKSEADLVVRYLDGDSEKTLVIENQYNSCDPNHLGRLLMYSADKNASVVVWVTENERPEYVKTISWLNRNSSEVEFYLIRIALYAIGSSLPAPVFEVLARPEEDGEKVEEEKKRSEAKELCYSFWKSCLADDGFIRVLGDCNMHQRSAKSEQWCDYSVGSSDVWLCAAVATKGGWVKVNFTVKNGSVAYDKLMKEDVKARMEDCLGCKLEPGQAGTVASTTINFYNRDVDITQGASAQADARKWFGQMLPRMKSFLVSENIIKK